jgi:glycosyltransferase involved in cell wall biosynthesis
VNILYISHSDLLGQQFNGHLLLPELRKAGHEAYLAVDIKKDKANPFVYEIGNKFERRVNKLFALTEKTLGLRNILPIQSLELFEHDWYKRADIIHLQLLHATQFFSLLQLNRMSKEKRIVWTIHDPWITTGHCVYSLGCDRWLNKQCNPCPYLSLNFRIPFDTAWVNWLLKRRILAGMQGLRLVVASKYMENLVKASPITAQIPSTLIPFGINTSVFHPIEKSIARKKLGLPEDAFVISFRSTPYSPYKGNEYIESALENIPNEMPVIILTFDRVGDLKKIRGRFPLLEIGWTDDSALIATALSASDVFLMPSLAEAFGVMAIESMACGTPIIVSEGTSLPDVVGDAGLVISQKDSAALTKAIMDLMNDEELRLRLGKNGVKRVLENYTLEKYTQSHITLYQEIMRGE